MKMEESIQYMEVNKFLNLLQQFPLIIALISAYLEIWEESYTLIMDFLSQLLILHFQIVFPQKEGWCIYQQQSVITRTVN